jgi:hypothetical protein
MSALVIAFPYGALVETPPPTATTDAVTPANVQSVASDLRARYLHAFDVFLDAAAALEKRGKGDAELEKAMNYAQNHASSVLERIRIEAKIANYERRGLTQTRDYQRQCRFREREAGTLLQRDDRGWIAAGAPDGA